MALKGKKHTAEHNARIAEAARRRYENPEERRKTSVAMMGNTNKLGYKVKDTSRFYRGGRIGQTQSEEEKAKRVESLEKTLKQYKPTKIELMVHDVLNQLEVEYVVHKRIRCYIPDIFIPSLNLILEIHGCWWHDCETCYGKDNEQHPGRREKDRIRIEKLSESHKVVVIWEHQLSTNDNMAVVMTAVRDQQ